MQRETIGFVGLGNMGAPMCRRLAETGFDVVAFDLDESRVGDAVDAGATAGTSAADCASRADLLLTSLPHPSHVATVMRDGGALAALRSGSVWVDLTTNRKELVLDLAADAPEGVAVVDSPVTGAVDGARTGRLTLFAARHDAPSIFAGHYDPSFTLDLCLKDLGLIEELRAGLAGPLPMTDAAHDAFAVAGDRYGREVGELHVAKRLEDDLGLDFRLDGDWTAPWEVTS